MNSIRPGFFKGAFKRLSILPRLIFTVRGWPHLLVDCVGRGQKPYFLRTSSGVTCEIRPRASDWWIFLEIFVFGIYSRAKKDIARADVIIDIGANVGFFALYAASIKSGATIHAFEPFPKNGEQLTKNLGLNPSVTSGKIVLHQAAVADHSGTMELYYTPGDDSGCTLNEVRGQSCTVEVIDINELYSVCGVTRCDLLKMDCEGSELSILQTASPAMLQAVQAIIMEYHVLDEVETIQNILIASGFQCEVLPEIKTIHATRRQ